MEEEAAKMDALQKEAKDRGVTDAGIQRRIDRPTIPVNTLQTVDAFLKRTDAILEQAGRRALGMDKPVIDRAIQQQVDTKHLVAEELNVRYDTLRSRLTQASETFAQLKKGIENNEMRWADRKDFITEHDDGKSQYTWEYTNKELEAERQKVLRAKNELVDFVNNELYEGSAKDYDDSGKSNSFEVNLSDDDLIGRI